MRNVFSGSIFFFIFLLAGATKLSGAPTVEGFVKILPQFDGWKREAPFSMPEDGFVTVGADYTRGDKSFQFMVIAGPDAPAAGPLPEELEEDRAAGKAETEVAFFSFFTLDGFDAVRVELKDESGATVWIDLGGKGWLLLGGDGMTADEIVALLTRVNLKQFARMVQ